MKAFGRIYTLVLVILCVVPVIYSIQFFVLVPNLRIFFYIELLIPIIGLGVGIYGLFFKREWINEKEEAN